MRPIAYIALFVALVLGAMALGGCETIPPDQQAKVWDCAREGERRSDFNACLGGFERQ